MSVTVLVGTIKGAFVLRSDAPRATWRIEGPIFKGWKVTAAARVGEGDAGARERWLVATASDVYGAAIQMSDDFATWRQAERGPQYPKGGKLRLNQIWTLFAGADALYAGVDEAGLFRSADGGSTWAPVSGLNEHATRAAWQPGFGGLCAHAVLQDAGNPRRLWCGISAVGVFRSDDGGTTWQGKNRGVPVILEDKVHKEIGYCVHGLAQDPDRPDTIYRQDHMGMYRTRDGGENWEKIESGLPSRFGFPIAIDRRTKALYAFPLESDEFRIAPGGRFRVFRSRNAGDAWEPLERGLPQEHAYAGVLRGALAVDGLDPCGVYVGSTAGAVYASRDGGDSWQTLPCTLPRILCVSAFVGE